MRYVMLLSIVLALTVPVSAERYSVNVRRIESNLYRDLSSRAILETRYCYVYAYNEDAILNWEGRYGNNWLLFVDQESKCAVVALR